MEKLVTASQEMLSCKIEYKQGMNGKDEELKSILKENLLITKTAAQPRKKKCFYLTPG